MLTTLCYIEQDGKYLMLYRNKKAKDINEGKWIGVGGKLEKGESPEECLVREVCEETGLILTGYRFRGIITFVNSKCEDEYMLLYLGTSFEGELKEDCSEGVLRWIPKEEIMELPLWEGDKIFLKPLMETENLIHLKLVYDGDRLIEAKA